MSIADEISRLETAKENLKTAIMGKGVAVAEESLSDYAGLVNQIPSGTTWCGTCSTDVLTAAKVVVCDGFTLTVGSRILVQFSASNSNANATLNVNGTGAKSIRTGSMAEKIKNYTWPAGACVEFVYDGTYWVICAPINGTWTPLVYFGGTAAETYTTQTGVFTKIGNVVTLSFSISATAPADGDISIRGFANICGNATAGYGGGGTLTPILGGSSNHAFIGYQTESSTSIVPLVNGVVVSSEGAYTATAQGVSGLDYSLCGTVTYVCR